MSEEPQIQELDPTNPEDAKRCARIQNANVAIQTLFAVVGLNFNEGMSAIGMVIAESVEPNRVDDVVEGLRLVVHRNVEANTVKEKRELN